MVVVPVTLLEVVSLFDGEHEIADIQAAVMRQRGELIDSNQIRELAGALDEHGFLDSPAFAERRARIDGEFLGLAQRPASHAGGLSDHPDALRAMMKEFFEPLGRPGAVDHRAAARPSALSPPHRLPPRGSRVAWATHLAERGGRPLLRPSGTATPNGEVSAHAQNY